MTEERSTRLPFVVLSPERPVVPVPVPPSGPALPPVVQGGEDPEEQQ